MTLPGAGTPPLGVTTCCAVTDLGSPARRYANLHMLTEVSCEECQFVTKNETVDFPCRDAENRL
jgi:hypothetical protein